MSTPSGPDVPPGPPTGPGRPGGPGGPGQRYQGPAPTPQQGPPPGSYPYPQGGGNPQGGYPQGGYPQGGNPQGGYPQGGYAGQYGVVAAPPPPPKKKRTWLIVLIVILVVILLVIVGCTALLGKAVTDAAKTAEPSVVATDSAPPPSSADTSGSDTPSAPSSSEASSSTSPSASADSNQAKLGDTLRYDDGIEVRVTGTKNTKAGQYAAGAHPGDPVTIFVVKVTNKSNANLNGDLVSAQLSYGQDGKNADQVFETDTIGDTISGTIQRGKAKTGDYAYAIPVKGRGDVTIEISIDYDHEHAIFSGSVA